VSVVALVVARPSQAATVAPVVVGVVLPVSVVLVSMVKVSLAGLVLIKPVAVAEALPRLAQTGWPGQRVVPEGRVSVVQ